MKRKKCPTCSKPETDGYRPFCSQHCADVDLGRWLNERYSIAGEATAQSGPSEMDEKKNLGTDVAEDV